MHDWNILNYKQCKRNVHIEIAIETYYWNHVNLNVGHLVHFFLHHLAPMQMNCGAQAGDGSTALQFSNASWLLIATKLDSRNGMQWTYSEYFRVMLSFFFIGWVGCGKKLAERAWTAQLEQRSLNNFWGVWASLVPYCWRCLHPAHVPWQSWQSLTSTRDGPRQHSHGPMIL